MNDFIIAMTLITALLAVFFVYMLVCEARMTCGHAATVTLAVQPTDEDEVSRAIDWTATLVIRDLDGNQMRHCRAPNQWDADSIQNWIAYAVPHHLLLAGVDVYVGGVWIGSTEC